MRRNPMRRKACNREEQAEGWIKIFKAAIYEFRFGHVFRHGPDFRHAAARTTKVFGFLLLRHSKKDALSRPFCGGSGGSLYEHKFLL